MEASSTNPEENTKNVDIIKGDPKKAIRKLSLPIMISMLLLMVYNLIDTIWVSGLGEKQLATMGFIIPLSLIFTGIIGGVSSGTNSLLSRAIGAERKDVANNAALHSIIITIILSIVIPLIAIPLLPNIITLIGGAATLEYSLPYATIMFIFMIIIVLPTTLIAILRSEGDVKRATYLIAISAIVDIILDPIMIYILKMGIVGAIYSTILSEAIVLIVTIYWIWIKKNTYLDMKFKYFKPKKFITIEIFKVAIPSALENLIISFFLIIIANMLIIVSSVAQVAIATVAINLISICCIPLLGLSNALLTVFGAAYGARNYEKMNTSFFYTITLGFIISIIIGVIIFIFAPQVTMIFTYTQNVSNLVPQITETIRILVFYMIAMSFGIAGSFIFISAGKGLVSLILTLIQSILCEIIFAYILGFLLGMGYHGIYWGVVLGCFVGSTISFIFAKFFLKKCKIEFESQITS